jgi:pyridoxal phosphate enzyme (YggS family)
MNSMPAFGKISEHHADVCARIGEVAASCGRAPESVTLIAVTKGFPVEDAMEAFRAGAHDLGENRVQELVAKADAFHAAGLEPRWHLIGSLQKNKVKYVVGRVAMIHSVDGLDLLKEISDRSVSRNVVTDILLQVNLSHELTKHGFDETDFPRSFDIASAMPGIRVRGLMTMAQPVDDPEHVRPVFAGLADLHERLRTRMATDAAETFDVLSMGMSHDYPVAIACGATHVRIGTAIFGGRSPNV